MMSRRSTPEDVLSCYRLLLGREPEQPQVLVDRALAYPSQLALVCSFLQTPEFQFRHGGALDAAFDSGSLSEFAASGLSGLAGYVTDFAGGLTRIDTLAWAHDRSGQVEMPPVLGNLFGSLAEWLAAFGAVRHAKLNGRERFVAIEVGAGWGPWLAVTGRAARTKGIASVRLIGIEPASELCEALQRHLADNGFSGGEQTVLRGAVIPGASSAEHPILAHPSIEFGHRSVARAVNDPPRAGWRACEVIDLNQILGEEHSVDVLILTTGGQERSIIQELDLRETNVQSIILATHSKRDDLEFWEIFSKAGWKNHVSLPCSIRQDDDDPSVLHLQRDGCQFWTRHKL